MLFLCFPTRISWNSNYPPTIIIILLQILAFNFFSLYFSTPSFFRSHHKEFVSLSSTSNPNQLLYSSSFFQHISFYHMCILHIQHPCWVVVSIFSENKNNENIIFLFLLSASLFLRLLYVVIWATSRKSSIKRTFCHLFILVSFHSSMFSINKRSKDWCLLVQSTILKVLQI